MAAAPTPPREILTWDLYGQAVRDLARQIDESGFRADMVLAIARGGLPVAGALAYSLSIKNCAAISVEYYTGVDARLTAPVVLPPVPNLVTFADLKVLIVDDVADTGHTLAMVEEFCRDNVAQARTAVLYHKPQSVIVPDFAWRTTDKWIDFCWSTGQQIVVPESGASTHS